VFEYHPRCCGNRTFLCTTGLQFALCSNDLVFVVCQHFARFISVTIIIIIIIILLLLLLLIIIIIIIINCNYVKAAKTLPLVLEVSGRNLPCTLVGQSYNLQNAQLLL